MDSKDAIKKILGVIPARFASTRFPGKPLSDIGGKSMIRRVYEQAAKCDGLSKVIVATDHAGIYEHVRAFGGEVCMTSATHVSGTDRCQEVLSMQSGEFDYVVNIQGDEPFIDPAQISLLIALLDGTTELATLIKRIDDEELLFNPNVVKAIVNINHEAIYFSRTAIPYLRNASSPGWLSHQVFYKHIGLYAYRADILKKITMLPVSSLERSESLEQLRWIENGYRIKVAETEIETVGIDTPDDLIKAITSLLPR